MKKLWAASSVRPGKGNIMENNEITLEKIELVKDRTGISYKDAKEALEEADGNVVDAIIAVESTIEASDKKDKNGNVAKLLEKVKEAVRQGNVNKISVKKNDEVILNLPVNAGLIGTVIFPWAAIVAVLAAFGTKCSIEIVKEGGEVLHISEKATGAFDAAVSKGGVLLDEAKDKGKDIYEAVKDKGEDLMEFAKDKGEDLIDFAKDKGEDIIDFAKDKGGDLIDYAKNKAAGLAEKNANKDPIQADNFDLSDLDLSEMGEKEECEE